MAFRQKRNKLNKNAFWHRLSDFGMYLYIIALVIENEALRKWLALLRVVLLFNVSTFPQTCSVWKAIISCKGETFSSRICQTYHSFVSGPFITKRVSNVFWPLKQKEVTHFDGCVTFLTPSTKSVFNFHLIIQNWKGHVYRKIRGVQTMHPRELVDYQRKDCHLSVNGAVKFTNYRVLCFEFEHGRS